MTAVAVALLFAAVSEEGAEVPCSVDGDAGFLVSRFGRRLLGSWLLDGLPGSKLIGSLLGGWFLVRCFV